jgi:hypothetical protein
LHWTTRTVYRKIPCLPPHGEREDSNGEPIFFDGRRNSAWVTRNARHSARPRSIRVVASGKNGIDLVWVQRRGVLK